MVPDTIDDRRSKGPARKDYRIMYENGYKKLQDSLIDVIAEEQAKLVAANIREGVTILGVEGTMSGSENMKPQAKTVTPSTSTAQQVLPDEGYNCLSQVTVNKIPYTESDNAAGGKTVTIG